MIHRADHELRPPDTARAFQRGRIEVRKVLINRRAARKHGRWQLCALRSARRAGGIQQIRTRRHSLVRFTGILGSQPLVPFRQAIEIGGLPAYHSMNL